MIRFIVWLLRSAVAFGWRPVHLLVIEVTDAPGTSTDFTAAGAIDGALREFEVFHPKEVPTGFDVLRGGGIPPLRSVLPGHRLVVQKITANYRGRHHFSVLVEYRAF